MRLLPRVVAATLAGGLLGAAVLVTAYARADDIEFPMAQSAPRVLWGFHGPERAGDLTFAWTTAQAGVTLQGLDRRVPWQCHVRLRGARPAGAALPAVSLSIDGLAGLSAETSNEFSDLTFAVPPRAERDGVVIALTATPVFVPGGGDRRELGVQVDHIGCRPEGIARPPQAPLSRATAVAALFAATFALLGAPLWLAAAGAAVVGLAQSQPITAGVAMYTPYWQRLLPFAAGAAAAALGLALLARGLMARLPTPAARFALGY
jgi:hypothetical protein